MVVLIIGPLPDPIDGCSISNKILCKNLSKRNITYQTINTNSKLVSSNQGSQFSFKKAISFFAVYFEIYKIFSSNIIYSTPGQTFFGILKYSPFYLLCIILGKPYIIHLHGNYLGSGYKRLDGIKKKTFHYLVSNASAGIVLSESLKANFKDLLPEDKIFIVENFAIDELYSNYNPTNKIRNKPVILFLSNLIEEKGIIDVLDALIVLKTSNIDFKAYLAGKIEEEYALVIKEKLQILGDCVEYMGVIQGVEKYKLLNKSNIFLLPTYYKMEGQPISILEAMAMGNIIITTKHAGIPDIVSEKNGFFVEKKNPSNVAQTIIDMSINIREEIQKFESTNIEYAKNNFREDIFSEKIIKIVERIQGEKKESIV